MYYVFHISYHLPTLQSGPLTCASRLRVQLTINGKLCTSPCEKKGEKYTWCYKSRNYCNERNCDWGWDYCSIDEHSTRYGDNCKDTCSRNEEDYYWCYLQDNTWDYCSPAPR